MKKKDDIKYPTLLAIERDDKGNLSVWCHFCNSFHHHGKETGHVLAHCIEDDSPFNETGYILKKVKLNGKEVIRKGSMKG